MISAFGALDDVFTWLTLALPTQTEQRKLLLISLTGTIKIVGIQSSLLQKKKKLSHFLTHTLNKQTCLRGLCCVPL